MVQPCTRCGKCCKSLRLGAVRLAEIDMEKWENHSATARGFTLLEWAEAGLIADNIDLWVSPSDGDEPERCPWLSKGRNTDICSCKIHDARPPVCRNFPLHAEQAIQFGCPMIEENDRNRPLAELDWELDAILGRRARAEAMPDSTIASENRSRCPVENSCDTP